MFNMRGTLLCVLALVIHTATASINECYELNTCSNCTGPLGENLQCVWCLDRSNKTVTDDGSNNKPPLNAAGQCSTSCPVDPTLQEDETFTLGIPKTVINATKNNDFTIDEPFAGLNVTRVNVLLRRGSTAQFTVALKKGPIEFDLYFLLDLSNSMSSSKEKIQEAAPDLPTAFDDDSAEVRPKPFKFGFGTFVDKSVPPFVYNRFEFLVPTFGYRHEVSFTNEAESFRDRVSDLALSGNRDTPEGGFDALVQSVLCKQYVAWAAPSVAALRLVLFVTDATSHVAGDGIVAGITWPAEMKCHSQLFFRDNRVYPSQMMNPLESHLYTCPVAESCWYHNVIHDYPSIEQIKDVLEESSARVAFVVPDNDDERAPGVREQYTEFEKILNAQGILAKDTLTDIVNGESNAFVQVVREVYYELFARQPVFSVIDGEEFLQYYSVSSTCVEKNSPGRSVTVENQEYELLYDCSFTVRTVPETNTPRMPLTATLSSALFGEFQLSVESSSCFCPSTNYFAGLEGAKCSNQGSLMDENCGVCQCDAATQAVGEYCDCDLEGLFSPCALGENGLECGGRGECECGRCRCEEPYYGTVCECSDLCNELDVEKRCGGPNAGVCECGKCICNEPRFSGENCECDLDNCKDSTGQICGGPQQGTCKCNACDCLPPYYGENCKKCDSEAGLSLSPPVLCGDDTLCNTCSQSGRDSSPDIDEWGCECCFSVSKPGFNQTSGSLCQWCQGSNQCISRETITRAITENRQLCSTRTVTETNEDNSTYVRQIYDVYNNISQCPPPEPYDSTPVVVGTVVGLLALILLAILLWRLLAYLKDKKEWEQYEKDKANSKWQADSNPIFKSSVAEYENPIFD